jgi:hypothetical protein
MAPRPEMVHAAGDRLRLSIPYCRGKALVEQHLAESGLPHAVHMAAGLASTDGPAHRHDETLGVASRQRTGARAQLCR